MFPTKKMTIKYWNSLSKESQYRALKRVFPVHDSIVNSLLNSKPNLTDQFWQVVFSKVREVLPDQYGERPYKTRVNHTYLK